MGWPDWIVRARQHHDRLDAVLAVLLALPAVAPFLSQLTRGYDTAPHILRFVLLDQSLAGGQALPRWSPELMSGYGYPLFNFYAPAVYYLGVLARRLGLDGAAAFQAVAAVLLATAAIGAWRLCRDLADAYGPDHGAGSTRRVAALVGAVVYVYAPYMLINVYVRGAIAELAAQALLPWVLWVFRRVATTKDPLRYAPAAALLLTGVIFSHTISLLLAPTFVVLMALVQAGKPTRRWLWVLGTGLTALAFSAMFWVALVFERGAVGTTAYQAAQQVGAEAFLQLGDWIWTAPTYPYERITSGLRFGLSLPHLLLAIAGVALWRRRLNRELVAHILVVIGVAALQLDVTRPLWALGGVIDVVQAPSRTQTYLYLSIAALTAIGLMRLPRFVEPRPLGVALMALLVVTASPWATLAPPWLESTTEAGLAQIANAEATGPMPAASAYPDFLPRWVDLSGGLANPAASGDVAATAVLTAIGPTEYRLRVDSPEAWILHTADFFFPGWSIWVDDAAVDVQAASPLGLVTAQIPAGEHEVRVAFVGSLPQQLGAWITTAAAACVAVLLGWRRCWSSAAATLVLMGLGLWMGPLGRADVQSVDATPLAVSGAPFDLLDVTTTQATPDRLMVRAVWFVRTAGPDVRLRWVLKDADGVIVAETRGRPWFDHAHSQAWPAGTVADDRAEIRLPGELPAGTYRLAVCAQAEAERATACEPTTVARTGVAISTPGASLAGGSTRISFEHDLDLVAAILETPEGDLALGEAAPVVTTEEALVLRLIWRARNWLLPERLDSTPIVMTRQGERLSYSTYPLAGLQGWPRSVPPGTLIVDRQQIDLDDAAAGGRYPVTVRVFDPATGAYLRVLDNTGQPVGDVATIGEIRLFASDSTRVAIPRDAVVGDVARFIGSELSGAGATLKPGGVLTLTVAYRALQPADRELTQFVHVYSLDGGLIAQADAPPRAGNNPAPSWIAGEVVRDTVVLTLSPDAPAGRYQVLWGLYDPVTGERVPITLPDGSEPADRALVLTEVQVAAP